MMKIFSDKAVNPRQSRDNFRKGSSLAESMVALGLVSVGLLGIVALYTRSFALNREVMYETIAAGLAAEGIEVVKNIVDAAVAEGRGWTIGDDGFEVQYDSISYRELARNPRPLYMNRAGVYSYDASGVPTSFTRSMRAASEGSSDERYRVTAVVEWNVGGTRRSLIIEDSFYKWRP